MHSSDGYRLSGKLHCQSDQFNRKYHCANQYRRGNYQRLIVGSILLFSLFQDAFLALT